MITPPKRILIVYIPQYTGRSEVLDTLKEYFKGIPHVVYPGYDEPHSVHLCYIVRPSRSLKKFLYKAHGLYFRNKILDYSYYEYDPDTVYNKAFFRYTSCIPLWSMSGSLILNATTIEKISQIIEE